jgi:hypothetical protein
MASFERCRSATRQITEKGRNGDDASCGLFCFASVLFLRGGDWLYRRHGLEDVIEQGR